MGYYIKRYGALSVRNALLILVGGYLFTVAVYQYRLERVTSVSDFEICWRFCGVNMVVMAYAVFSLVSRIKWQGNNAFGRWISQVSVMSYAIYFVHLIMVFTWHGFLRMPLCGCCPNYRKPRFGWEVKELMFIFVTGQ